MLKLFAAGKYGLHCTLICTAYSLCVFEIQDSIITLKLERETNQNRPSSLDISRCMTRFPRRSACRLADEWQTLTYIYLLFTF